MNGPRERIRAATFVLLVTGSAATAGPGIPPGALPGSARAAAALERCAAADHAHGTARADLLQQALALAEEAVDADDADARAHFAVFCALGKQMRAAGLSVFNLGKLRRVRREIDRALELAPDSADALVGKGSLLRAMPRLLGGDLREAGRLRGREGGRAARRHRTVAPLSGRRAGRLRRARRAGFACSRRTRGRFSGRGSRPAPCGAAAAEARSAARGTPRAAATTCERRCRG